MHLGVIKTELQSWGVRIPFRSEGGRKGGAGPAEGITLLFGKNRATVPIYGDYVERSPYEVKENNGTFVLLKNGRKMRTVDFLPSPRFYTLQTEEGIPYKKIALLHGTDCLASTVYQDCIYWDSPLRCKFCGIKLSLENNQTTLEKTSEQLAEVAAKAKALDNIRHVTLTTGTTNGYDKGIKKLAQMGVYPFIVPLRPIPHTLLEKYLPPLPERLIYLYQKVAHFLRNYHLSAQNSKAGCVRCGACSALPEFEIRE